MTRAEVPYRVKHVDQGRKEGDIYHKVAVPSAKALGKVLGYTLDPPVGASDEHIGIGAIYAVAPVVYPFKIRPRVVRRPNYKALAIYI